MPMNYVRHLEVFDPDTFRDSIDIVGAGATGSRVAMSLAKLGIKKINIWDFDKIESHNIPNQTFGLKDVGKYKALVLADMILRDTGIAVDIHRVRANGKDLSGSIVFLLTDTMESRRIIWNGGIRMNMRVRLMIETRMGADLGRVYAVDPTSKSQVEGWEKTLSTDDKSQDSPCGGSVSVGPTADMLAGLAVWQFLKWNAFCNGQVTQPVENEVIFGLRPLGIYSRSFSF